MRKCSFFFFLGLKLTKKKWQSEDMLQVLEMSEWLHILYCKSNIHDFVVKKKKKTICLTGRLMCYYWGKKLTVTGVKIWECKTVTKDEHMIWIGSAESSVFFSSFYFSERAQDSHCSVNVAYHSTYWLWGTGPRRKETVPKLHTAQSYLSSSWYTLSSARPCLCSC